jgi:hypothetical protein
MGPSERLSPIGWCCWNVNSRRGVHVHGLQGKAEEEEVNERKRTFRLPQGPRSLRAFFSPPACVGNPADVA